jgi:hypothetical protein
LTDTGLEEDRDWLSAELRGSVAHSDVSTALQDFLKLNPRLLDVCTDWQMQKVGEAHVLNDHTDAGYDFRTIERLATIDEAVQPILLRLSDRLPRFAPYGKRLRNARSRVESGDHSYFTESLYSYHTVWFQIHEDLLTTLGLQRDRYE